MLRLARCDVFDGKSQCPAQASRTHRRTVRFLRGAAERRSRDGAEMRSAG